jgi:glutathione synthase/RimK-type ligase-like ATP-grasp enzyme
MQISYTTDAFISLTQLVNFIESTNTAGAGVRWLKRYELFLKATLNSPEHIRLCHNQTFNNLKLRCIYFNDWLIAFSIKNESILIEALLHKSRITD